MNCKGLYHYILEQHRLVYSRSGRRLLVANSPVGMSVVEYHLHSAGLASFNIKAPSVG